ncbi:MAG: hypothetical protein PHH09_08490, partial [Methanoregulaceae archaeon]|nr:hypothetical protein [Methanoregulaceae archaeon]
MDEDERRGLQNTFYEWEPLQLAVKRESIFPSNHPFTRYLPKGWHQGDRGSCFAGRTRVLMADMTYKPINAIKEGELVFTHTGKIRRVIECMKRPWQGVTYRINITGIPEPIECTKEHPFLTDRGWVAAEQLTTRDHVFFPNLIDETNDKTLNEFERDPDFLWVLGLYIAEGSIDRGCNGSGSRVTFSLHAKEIGFAERVEEVMRKYGATVTYHQNGENGLVVRLAAGYDGYWCNIFEDLGGKMCFGKRIHQRLMTLDPQLQTNIFDGWFAGDGYTRMRHGNSNRVGVSTSEALVYQMWRILARNHIYGSIQKRADQEGRLQSWSLEIIGEAGDSYRRQIVENGAFVRIQSIEKVPCYFGQHVYNLEVEGDHSYIVEGVAVHNCVGHACAIWMQCNYYALTNDYPAPDEIDQSARDQELDLKTCFLVYDKWYRTVFSAQWCYHISRVVGNVTYPSGSYCSAAADAMRKVGAVGWDQCLTPKTPFCAPTTYPFTFDETKSLCKDHIIDGFAKV